MKTRVWTQTKPAQTKNKTVTRQMTCKHFQELALFYEASCCAKTLLLIFCLHSALYPMGTYNKKFSICIGNEGSPISVHAGSWFDTYPSSNLSCSLKWCFLYLPWHASAYTVFVLWEIHVFFNSGSWSSESFLHLRELNWSQFSVTLKTEMFSITPHCIPFWS